ncbi:DUF222 domain-containing protein [Microbacterium sp. NPDC090007]|uniref:HNH endonuclease signature motif containing protein n=1 Tax=Microbacterium sp. NPDC090007 TaxID=3364204 RepID=UPI00382CB4B6
MTDSRTITDRHQPVVEARFLSSGQGYDPFPDAVLPLYGGLDAPPPDPDDLRLDIDTAWALQWGVEESMWPDLDTEWPVSHDLGASTAAGETVGSGALTGTGSPSALFPPADPASFDGPVSPETRLAALDAVATDRRRASAEEYSLIAQILDDAVATPEPWAGADPTLDLAWDDARGRSVAAVRRDRLDMAERAAVAEIAVRLRLSEQTVRVRAGQARTLQQRSPVTWRTFVEGRTSERHAVETARLASSLPHDDAESWKAFDVGAADRASRLTPARFAVSARALRERVHAESLEMRHRRAARDRGVWITAELDGMATLSALMPADRAYAAMSTLDRAARHLATASDEDRTLAHLRADVMADLLASPPDDCKTVATAVSPFAATSTMPGAPPATTSATGSTAPSASPAPTTSRKPVTSREPTTTPTPAGSSPHESSSPPAGRSPHESSSPPAGRSPHVSSSPPAGGSPHVSSSPPSTSNASPLERTSGPPRPGGSPPRSRPGAASIVVTVPALTLLGVDDEPAVLDGYGPIDLDTARRLAGDSATWTRVLTHPLTGAPLALDRTSYRVTAALRRWLGVTSPTCVFPGCGRAARGCDIDHLTAWADGGVTDADNLEPECRHHHRLRHETKWTPVRDPASGDVRWRSPLGHETDVDPAPF